MASDDHMGLGDAVLRGGSLPFLEQEKRRRQATGLGMEVEVGSLPGGSMLLGHLGKRLAGEPQISKALARRS